MFTRLKQRQPGATAWSILYRMSVRGMLLIWMRLCYRFRVIGADRMPGTGPLVLVCNHQSFLDPVVLGIAAWHRRMFWPMARASLFRNPLFGGIIRSLNARPVERGEADMKAIRGSIDLLKAGQALLVFAEGTRTDDGTTQPFKSGLMLLVRRAKATVVPVAIDGAFDIWPRSRKLPKFTGSIRVQFGEPVGPDALLAMDSEAASALLRDRVEQMRQDLSTAAG